MTFTRDDRTVLGDDPAKVARALNEAGADVIGVNCSGGPAQLLRLLKDMRQAVPNGRFSVKPNAGWPEQVGGRIMYPADPDYFGDYALSFREAGASQWWADAAGQRPSTSPPCARRWMSPRRSSHRTSPCFPQMKRWMQRSRNPPNSRKN